MLDHVSLQSADAERSAAFYVQIFAALGVTEAMRVDRPEGTVIGLSGLDGFPHLWIGPLVDRGNRPIHLALTAPSVSAVDDVYRAALDAGTEILHKPHLWPDYHPGYYGVFIRDLDGNNVEAVHHAFPTKGSDG